MQDPAMSQPYGQPPRPDDSDLGVGGPPEKRSRPWGWIAACVVLLLVAGGFAVWAFGAQSDLDDQKAQTEQAQQEAEQANDQIGALTDQLDDVTQAVDDAGDDLAQAGDEAGQSIDAALADIKAKLAALKEQLALGAASGGEAEPTATPAADTEPTVEP